jgi:hypothetical protein
MQGKGDKSLIFNNMDKKKKYPHRLCLCRGRWGSVFFLIHNIYLGNYLIIAVLPSENVKSSMRTAAPGFLAFMITML